MERGIDMAKKEKIMYSKSEFIKRLAEQEAMTQKDAAKFVDAFLNTVKDILVEGNSVRFMGFGSFDKIKRAARKGKNPATGEDLKIPAHNTVTFKASKPLKDAVNTKSRRKK